MQLLIFDEFGLYIHDSKWRFSWDIGAVTSRSPEGSSLRIVKIGPPVVAQLNVLLAPQMLFNGPDTSSRSQSLRC